MTIWLVVGFNHPEKWSESQWVSDDIPYMKWKIKAMFETTNQSFGPASITQPGPKRLCSQMSFSNFVASRRSLGSCQRGLGNAKNGGLRSMGIPGS